MDRNGEISRGLKILGNYSEFVQFKTGMMLAGPTLDVKTYRVTAEEERMLKAAAWNFFPYYNRWVYLCQ